MWRPSLSNVGKLTVAGVLLLASAEAEACLFPCLWGWGCWSPQPMYAAPVYSAPAFAPSPCGPGGCPTGGCPTGGCSSFYGPTACCSSCSSCCSDGCSTCSGGSCSGGDCAANYSSNSKLQPTPDSGGSKEPTYSPEPKNEEPPKPGDMPPDDFLPPARPGEAGAGGAATSSEPPAGGSPAAQPMPDDILPGKTTLHVLPVRQRTDVRAQYRAPRVARLQVAPATEWQRVAEGRLAKR